MRRPVVRCRKADPSPSKAQPIPMWRLVGSVTTSNANIIGFPDR
jgi:hypothetical protein